MINEKDNELLIATVLKANHLIVKLLEHLNNGTNFKGELTETINIQRTKAAMFEKIYGEHNEMP